MPRFVVHRHEPPIDGEGSLHWDLMFEVGPSLKTWSLAEEPRSGATIAARSLPDHRREYLDYEGPISRNRGSVSRWDQGTFELVSECEEAWVARVEGEVLHGTVRFARSPSDVHRWSAEFSSG